MAAIKVIISLPHFFSVTCSGTVATGDASFVLVSVVELKVLMASFAFVANISENAVLMSLLFSFDDVSSLLFSFSTAVFEVSPLISSSMCNKNESSSIYL